MIKGRALSHLDSNGEISMVNVEGKESTPRTAIAECVVQMKPETLVLLRSGKIKKGDAFTAAKIAGIMAAKKTFEFIPLCHPIALEHIDIHFTDRESQDGLVIQAEVRTTGKTGVEMEALTAVMVSALTIYDMAKSYDREMMIGSARLLKKTGGKSDYFLKSSYSHSK